MIGDAGYVLGPLVVGLMVDFGNTTTALMVCAVMMVVSAVAFAVCAPESHQGNARATSA